MSYFSLLYGDKLHQVPDKKIVPASEFSKLIDGEALLTQIREEIERHREEVAKECEQLRTQAKEEGFAEGLAKWSEQIGNLEQEIDKVRQEMMSKLLPIALKGAEKIVGREMTLNRATIGDIVLKCLKDVTDHRRITVYCHRDDLDALNERREEMKALFERLDSLVIQDRDDVQQGGCIIETEAGIINAQWETLMGALERALQVLFPGGG